MHIQYDSQMDEQLARGGSFDLTGTNKDESKQFWGFHASDGAVISAIKGVPLATTVTTLAGIRTAEVNLDAHFVTSIGTGLMANVLYRVDGYIITSVTLTSGSLHLYKMKEQISV